MFSVALPITKSIGSTSCCLGDMLSKADRLLTADAHLITKRDTTDALAEHGRYCMDDGIWIAAILEATRETGNATYYFQVPP